jgi:hypothetical protein
MNTRMLKLGAWSGFVFMALFLLGFVVVARFIPPPAPSHDATWIANFFHQHATRIRFGMIITMAGAVFLAPFVSLITIQMRRIEGPNSILAWTQLALGAILILEFLYLIFFWQTATFRVDRPAATIQTLNDLCWLPFTGMTGSFFLECILFAVVILRDKRRTPIFPRWSGYMTIWAATTVTPGTFSVFFHHGPVAWNGLLAFYVPVVAFGIWYFMMSLLLLRAVDHQVAEEAVAAEHALPAWSEVPPGPIADSALTAEVAALRAEVERLSTRADGDGASRRLAPH